MGGIGKFFDDDTSAKSVSLQLLFAEKGAFSNAAQITELLRAYDASMAEATCELDESSVAQGTPVGIISWGAHRIRVVGFDLPMPQPIVELCVAPSHYRQEIKTAAYAHSAHAILYYAGDEKSAREQYAVLAAVGGALHGRGAIVIMNETGHTSFPAEVLAKHSNEMMEELRDLPLCMLYSGFVKYDVQGSGGTWMRTYGNHVFGIPDFAYFATGHKEGESTFNMMCSVMEYILSSGVRMAPGNTMQVGSTEVLQIRAPTKSEYFLKSEGEMLVLEKMPISAGEVMN